MDQQKDFDCCPEFNPEPWQDKLLKWEEKRFIKGKVFTFFFMPINFGGVMKKLDKLAKDAGAKYDNWLCLSDHTSKFNMDVYLAVDKEVPGAENVTLSGEYYSRVYEGDFKDTGKWCKDFDEHIAKKGLKYKKMYMWYTTCPKCAKKYGKNYTVIVAELE